MYDIPYFKASEQGEVIHFMKEHPFITLCGCDKDGKPAATHIPVLTDLRDDKLFLLGHVMRKQQHTKTFHMNKNVLAIFYGAHTYVSASWYAKKNEASTWNYQAVHAKGILNFLDDEALHKFLIRLTEKFENNPGSPSLVQKMDEHYVRNLMKAIVALEIEVTSVEHVFKLSQNRDEKSFENIIAHLNQQDEDAKLVAGEMEKRKHKIFPK